MEPASSPDDQVNNYMLSWLYKELFRALLPLHLAQKLPVLPQTSGNQSESLKQQMSALIHPGPEGGS
ncbi:hypothetical protein P7K49_021939 [Saguinus oedipus]|uniref:Uncharacterized protein n=1 Tax=Saguinus oedipus TaxID=9490 RepID=A0ABQ9UU52_SAGOE|nr:hypothetical protein P7K49_021939 [Saguinus oedipus]